MISIKGVTRMAVWAAMVLVAAGPAKAEDWSPLWTTTTLSQERYALGATSEGGKVFFGGGWTGTSYSDVVDIFDAATLTRTTSSLSQARSNLAATSAGGKVFFAGGWTGTSNNVVDIFDAATLTLTTTSLSQAREYLAAASEGGKVFFGGGSTSNQRSNVVDIFDAATLTLTTTSLSQARHYLAATSAGGKVFFGGGSAGTGAYSDVVDIYDTASSTWSTAQLSQARGSLAATSAGGKVFFAGGNPAAPHVYSNVVDIFDAATLTRTTTSLSQARSSLAAASVGGKVFFAGGTAGNGIYSNVVDIYDTATGTWSIAQLSLARWGLSAASAGNRAFFGGGTGDSNVVDIYTLQHYGTITSTQDWTLVDNTSVAGRMQLNGGSLNLDGYDLVVGSMAGVAPISLEVQTLTAGGDDTSSTYSGDLSGQGGLIKTGAGTLTLTADNTYTGDTTVSAGTLSVTTAFFDDLSTVYISSGTTLDLNHSDIDDILYLYLGGSQMPKGLYDASISGGYLSGGGSLNVTMPEPATLSLLAAGLGAVWMRKRRGTKGRRDKGTQ